jgi:N-acetyl-beta-hexosaminidase
MKSAFIDTSYLDIARNQAYFSVWIFILFILIAQHAWHAKDFRDNDKYSAPTPLVKSKGTREPKL